MRGVPDAATTTAAGRYQFRGLDAIGTGVGNMIESEATFDGAVVGVITGAAAGMTPLMITVVVPVVPIGARVVGEALGAGFGANTVELPRCGQVAITREITSL